MDAPLRLLTRDGFRVPGLFAQGPEPEAMSWAAISAGENDRLFTFRRLGADELASVRRGRGVTPCRRRLMERGPSALTARVRSGTSGLTLFALQDYQMVARMLLLEDCRPPRARPVEANPERIFVEFVDSQV